LKIKLPWGGRKKKKFFVYLTRKGIRQPLGVVEAASPEEVANRIVAMCAEGKIDCSQYNRILIIESETGSMARIKNPFAQEEAEGGGAGERTTKSKSYLDISTIKAMIAPYLMLNTELTKMFVASVGEGFKEMVKGLASTIVETYKSAIPNPQSEIDAKKMDLVIKGLEFLTQCLSDTKKCKELFAGFKAEGGEQK